MARSVASFLADRPLVEGWLAAERTEVEAQGGQLSHWGKGQQLGIVISQTSRSGEMHVDAKGNVSRHVEGPKGTILLTGASAASDENGVKVLYQEFKAKVLGK